MFCKRCGAELTEDAKFCTSCGEPIKSGPEVCSDSDTSDSHEEGKMDEDLKAFVGKNTEYYNRKWKNVDRRFGGGWNWVAFFLLPFWLGYRKMYAILIGVIVLNLLFTIINVILDSIVWKGFFAIVFWGLPVASGKFGNKLYYRHAKKKIAKIKNDGIVKDTRSRISKAGGTSKRGVWLPVGLSVVGSVFLIVVILFTHPGKIVFGTHIVDGNHVAGITDTFQQDDDIYYQVTLVRPVDTTQLSLVLVRRHEDEEETIKRWKEKVDPSWVAFYVKLYAPQIGYPMLPAGQYILRIYKNDDSHQKHQQPFLQGEFTITAKGT